MTKDAILQNHTIQNYYRFQSAIYDATRWSFLFGRKRIIDLLQFDQTPAHIFEVGCGTGKNLVQLTKLFPHAQLTGIDVSEDMLALAQKKFEGNDRVKLIDRAYGQDFQFDGSAPDVVLFSYALTMINPQYAELIAKAQSDLKPGGHIAVVDFHSSPVGWFKRHMLGHHVRMDGHLDPVLKQHFRPVHSEQCKAYGGLWNYFLFIGLKE